MARLEKAAESQKSGRKDDPRKKRITHVDADSNGDATFGATSYCSVC